MGHSVDVCRPRMIALARRWTVARCHTRGALATICQLPAWTPWSRRHARARPPSRAGPARCPSKLLRYIATLSRLDQQPRRQLVATRVQAAWVLRHLEPYLDSVGPQVFADGVPRQARPPFDLADQHVLPVKPPANDAEQLHVDLAADLDDSVGTWVRHRLFLSENSGPLRLGSQCNSTSSGRQSGPAPWRMITSTRVRSEHTDVLTLPPGCPRSDVSP